MPVHEKRLIKCRNTAVTAAAITGPQGVPLNSRIPSTLPTVIPKIISGFKFIRLSPSLLSLVASAPATRE